MKKLFTLILAAGLTAGIAAAAWAMEEEPVRTSDGEVMSYEEYMAAELDTKVTIETYVQAKQSWWEDKATLYTQDEDGGYFIYSMACSEEEYDRLTEGTKIRVTGWKSEWSGEVEIVDASFEIIEDEEDTYIAKAANVTEYLGTDEIQDYMNQYVSFKGLTIEPQTDFEGNEAAFLYNWNGSGAPGENCDLYFKASLDGEVYTFTVESYLCGSDTDVYQAVENLQVGDVIDMKGFLYWYEGPNPHITEVKPAGKMSYEDYLEAEYDTEVTVTVYVQATQEWWEDKISVYASDEDGGYFIYNMACSKEDAEKLLPGTKICVTGWKSEWAGEVEIVDAEFTFVDDGETLISAPEDVTELLGTDRLADYMNRPVIFKGLTVEAQTDEDGNEKPFLYGWNGAGSHEENSDIYFNASRGGETFTFTIESYLCGNTTDVYAAAEALEAGQEIDLEGFLYWYEGPNPHITSITVKE